MRGYAVMRGFGARELGARASRDVNHREHDRCDQQTFRQLGIDGRFITCNALNAAVASDST